jgi:hypothetical protein
VLPTGVLQQVVCQRSSPLSVRRNHAMRFCPWVKVSEAGAS